MFLHRTSSAVSAVGSVLRFFAKRERKKRRKRKRGKKEKRQKKDGEREKKVSDHFIPRVRWFDQCNIICNVSNVVAMSSTEYVSKKK